MSLRCYDQLVWVEASGFWLLNTGLSLGNHLDILLSCVVEIQQFHICRSSLFMGSSSSSMRYVLVWATHGLGGSWVNQSASFLSLSLPWWALQHSPGYGYPTQCKTGSGLLLSCPWSWLTHSGTSRASSSIWPRRGAGSACPSAAVDEVQGLFSHSYALRPALPPAAGEKGW